MLDSSIINGRSARTTFFILFVGGLYFLISALLANFCNTVIFGVIHIPCITTLEASGLIAFLFIIYFGIKFGLKMNTLNNNQGSNVVSEKSSNTNINETVNENYLEYKIEIIAENNITPNISNSSNQTIENSPTINTDKSTKTDKENFFTINQYNKNQSKCLENIEKMTEEQKKQLQLTLAKNYGIQIKKEKEFV
ncbi:MAG: hypothetical protein ACOVNU_04545 [Candidatus Kapaibacteriota bacterium]